jgi:putative aldouronate transport system permease protein
MNTASNPRSIGARALRALRRDKFLLVLIAPVLLYYLVFQYLPMYGLVIAFKDFSSAKGILGSPWAGLKWFESFVNSIYFFRTFRNTVLISLYSILWGFPIPVIFAIFLNEVKGSRFKRFVQTASYLPHFISVVVIAGMVLTFVSTQGGIVNRIIELLGGRQIAFMNEPGWFRTIYVASGVWQNFGWNSIIYLAAIATIDPQLYEAARIDGASRLRQIAHVTIPSILPTVIILLILDVGSIMDVGFEKIILLYSPVTYETADVISTYIYRRGIIQSQFSLGAAVGMFNSIINLIVLISFNWISRKVSQTSLW